MMAKKEFRGVFTAIITPFKKNGQIDENAYLKLLDAQIQAGVAGIVPCGTTGESPTTSHEEDQRLFKLTVKHVDGRALVVPGTGSNATSEALQLSKHAQDAGADAVLLVNPYYNKPTQKGLYLHFKVIADSLNIPCILYNIKGRTAVNVETPTMVRLMNDCPNIVGVKEASGDLNQMKDLIRQRKKGFKVLSGDDNMTLNLIEAGGDGVISVASNIIPKQIVEMVDLALKGNMAKARTLEKKYAELMATLFIETNPIPLKTALAMQGKCEEVFRLPMCGMEPKNKQKLRAVMQDLKIL